jgi:hypothetical protein
MLPTMVGRVGVHVDGLSARKNLLEEKPNPLVELRRCCCSSTPDRGDADGDEDAGEDVDADAPKPGPERRGRGLIGRDSDAGADSEGSSVGKAVAKRARLIRISSRSFPVPAAATRRGVGRGASHVEDLGIEVKVEVEVEADDEVDDVQEDLASEALKVQISS